jgi:hypothetical protein
MATLPNEPHPDGILELTELAPAESIWPRWRGRAIAAAVGAVLGAAIALASELVEDDTCHHCQWASAAPAAGVSARPIPDIESVERADVRSATEAALIVRARTAMASGDLEGARWYLDSAARLGADEAGLGDMRRLLDLLRTLPRDA